MARPSRREQHNREVDLINRDQIGSISPGTAEVAEQNEEDNHS